MRSRDVLLDAFDRIPELVHAVLDGADDGLLTARLDPAANSIAWLVWHLTRVQDDHVADAAGTEQVWTSAGWAERFGLPLAPSDTGYGHDPDQVAAVRASAELLRGYHDAVHAETVKYVGSLDDADLDRVVDTRWDPPVTLGVRLVSVIGDCQQHVAQAAYVRGVLERTGR
ncbi:mycothiol transferase [Puerhibacterium puerhi]|uniref:mycothiol transferase n=1 Tax=Puerhibacterium puerhi TaxID=2692623 RepID=UPI001357FF14|nr:DinB family protein [Puerhibacterium puerhi]